MAEQVVQSIRAQHLHVASFHHRSLWGDLPALRDSIIAEGIINPLQVRKRKAGGYEIIAGVRRFKAGSMAELKTFPCLVEELDDDDAVARQFAENQDRADLHPIDVALYCEEFSRQGMDAAQIAKRLCLKRREVVAKMRLLALSPAARKAFVDGKFDEEAAVALASTSDPAKQRDVISALDAGTLQADEIVGYIRREFTAQLDDVPWRMTDEKLVVKAGACSTCPKRSDAQKELFPSGQTGLRCLDVDCYRAKMDATWQGELARPGVQLLDQRPESLFVLSSAGTRPTSMRSSGMVDADAPCPHLLGKTWREAVFAIVGEGEPPTVYLARDQDGRPRFLMREGVVGKMVRKSDAAKGAPAEATDDAAPGDAAAPSTRAEGKIRRTILAQFAERVIAGDHDTWEWVTERVIDGATARVLAIVHGMLEEAIRAIGAGMDAAALDVKAGLSALAQSSNRQAKRVATAILIFEEADVVWEIPPSLRALGDRCGVEIDAIEREVRKS